MTTMVVKRNGTTQPFDASKIDKAVDWATQGLDIDPNIIKDGAVMLIRPNMPTSEIQLSLVQSAAKLIKRSCMDASKAAARLALLDIYSKVNAELGYADFGYAPLRTYIERGVADQVLTPELLEHFDLEALNKVIIPENDLLFDYLGSSHPGALS